MTEDELKALIQKKISGAKTQYAGIANQIDNAEDAYYGKAVGDFAAPAIEDRSSIVASDVADTIEWMMPSLIKIFAGGDKAVEFVPRDVEDEESAKLRTEYVNYIFYSENNGFLILYDWFKSALLYKLGVVKVWWDTGGEKRREKYQGLTSEQYLSLLADPNIEVKEYQENGDSFDITLIRTIDKGQVRISVIPKARFAISSTALSFDDSDFYVHHERRSLSQLRLMGYQNVDDIQDAEVVNENDTKNENEEEKKFVYLNECYIKCDYDGDGIDEWRKVVEAGGQMLENTAVSDHPFCAICPIPMPNSVYGQSIADVVYNIQKNKTSMYRVINDGAYLSVYPRTGVVENQVEIDDLLNHRPAGVVRMKTPGAVFPLAEGKIDLGMALSYLETIESWKENRSGWTRYSQGANADSLNNTATGINIITNRGDARLELIGKIFAETGVKELFRKILKLVIQNQDKPKTVRLFNRWVKIDPREWSEHFDLSVNVALGTGNKDQVLNHLMVLSQVIEKAGAYGQAVGADLVTPDNVYNVVIEIARNMGFKSPEKFIAKPQQQPPQPPQADPKHELDQQKLELEKQKFNLDQQVKTAEIQNQQEQNRIEWAKLEVEANRPNQKVNGIL